MSELDLHVRERVAWLTLNRPERRNALSPELLQALIEACATLREDTSVHVVVLSGAAGTFSGGADVAGFLSLLGSDDAEAGADLGRRAAEALASLPQVTVAAIEGCCVGGGVVLAGACDLRWAATDAWLSVPELELGIPFAWGGTEMLVRLVGETAAADLVLTGRRVEAEEAARLGFVSTLVDVELDDESEDGFAAWVEDAVATLASRPANVLRATKAQLAGIRAGTFDARTDAPALIAALNDPESQHAAQEYIARRVRAAEARKA